jgi:hypothetical protein
MLKQSLLSLTLFAATLTAAPVVIPDTVLDDMPSGESSFTYTGLDGSGTSMTASRTGGSFDNLVGGTWPGLWLGGNNTSGI